MFVKNSGLDKIDNDLLILKYSCCNEFHVSYEDGESYVVDVDDLIIDDYSNYKNNQGTNLKLDGLTCIKYVNKENNSFSYYYGGC